MKTIFAFEPLPYKQKGVFLAGPSPRDSDTLSWRPKACDYLEQLNFDGYVYIPESADGIWTNDYFGQVDWEESALITATVILFWIPRDLEKLPGFTTNDEWGFWKATGKCVLGTPPEAAKVAYQRYYAKKLGVPLADTLEETCKNAVERANKFYWGS